jgi:methionyl-tRNA formyltransferase
VHDFIIAQQDKAISFAGYSRILPAGLFEDLRFGAINCHGGRPPEYRGASPVPWQIINGETYGVVYVLKMTAGIDDGPVLAERRYEISPEETARHVTEKVCAIFETIVPDAVESFALCRPLEERPQSDQHALMSDN